jgi:hypothetical protein
MCSLGFLGYGLYSIGFGGSLFRLLPICFITGLFLFFFITGLKFFNDDQNKATILCVEICLLLQTFQLNILGFSLSNFYGPYLAIGFSDTPELRILIKHHLFRWLMDDGYSPDGSISVLINCFQLLLYVLFLFFKKELLQKEGDALLDL